MGYEAMTGRLPDAIALHFLESGLVGKVDVGVKSPLATAGLSFDGPVDFR